MSNLSGGIPVGFLNYLTLGEWIHACQLWREGKDTKEIASKLQCSESLIYNKLPHYRRKYKDIDMAAA